MKKLIYTVVLGAVLTGSLGCKKGEDDPALSLRSRKARLTGEWKVSSSNEVATYTSEMGLTSTATTTFDGTTETTDYVATGFESHSTRQVTMDLTFEKDGTYKMMRTEVEAGETYSETTEGNWAFIGKSKKAGLKNKEAVALSLTKYSDSDGYNETLDGSFLNFQTLIISQLKNKEIVVSYDESSTESSFGSSTRKGSMTLTKK